MADGRKCLASMKERCARPQYSSQVLGGPLASHGRAKGIVWDTAQGRLPAARVAVLRAELLFPTVSRFVTVTAFCMLGRTEEMVPLRMLAIAIWALLSAEARAWYVENPVERALTATTLVPTMIVGATTAFTVDGPAIFKSAKSDAIVFIGSDGEIRGAHFEQASRYYRATHSLPLMSDRQLARVIVTSY